MPTRLTHLACASALVVTTALAGCSSSGGGAPSTPPQSSHPAAGTPATSTPPTSPASGAGSSTAQSAALVPLLVSASEIGTGFSAKADDSSDDTSGAPCTPHAKDPTDQYPPDRQAKVTYANASDTVEVSQHAVAYDDASTAAKVVSATETGLDCKTGTIDGKSVVIEPVTGSTPSGLDVAKRWDAEIASENVVATFFLYAKNSTVELLGFIAAKSAATSVDVRLAASAAAAKLVRGAK